MRKWIACGMAMRTDEAVAPSSFFHVGSTLRFIGKKLLKLWKRPRKGQVVTLKDVHGSLSIIHTKSIPSGCVRQADRQGLKFEFHGSRITSDAGLLAYRELDEALGLTTLAGDVIADSRTGKNGWHGIIGLLRQSVYGRLAGYEDVNDADRAGARSCDAADRRRRGCRARRRIDQPDGPVRDGVTRHQ